MTRAGLLQQLTGAFLDYAGTLNQLLFSEDNPQLLRISADFARLAEEIMGGVGRSERDAERFPDFRDLPPMPPGSRH